MKITTAACGAAIMLLSGNAYAASPCVPYAEIINGSPGIDVMRGVRPERNTCFQGSESLDTYVVEANAIHWAQGDGPSPDDWTDVIRAFTPGETIDLPVKQYSKPLGRNRAISFMRASCLLGWETDDGGMAFVVLFNCAARGVTRAGIRVTWRQYTTRFKYPS